MRRRPRRTPLQKIDGIAYIYIYMRRRSRRTPSKSTGKWKKSVRQNRKKRHLRKKSGAHAAHMPKLLKNAPAAHLLRQ